MARFVALVALVALLLPACGGGDRGETPEGLARAYVSAFFSGDEAALKRLWATRAELDALWACDGTAPDDVKAGAARDLAGLVGGLHRYDAQVRFVDWDAERTRVDAGGGRDGCTAQRAVEIERGDVGFAIQDRRAPASARRVEHHGLTMMRIGGRWRLVGWSP